MERNQEDKIGSDMCYLIIKVPISAVIQEAVHQLGKLELSEAYDLTRNLCTVNPR